MKLPVAYNTWFGVLEVGAELGFGVLLVTLPLTGSVMLVAPKPCESVVLITNIQVLFVNGWPSKLKADTVPCFVSLLLKVAWAWLNE